MYDISEGTFPQSFPACPGQCVITSYSSGDEVCAHATALCVVLSRPPPPPLATCASETLDEIASPHPKSMPTMILSCEDEDEPPASVSGTGGDGSSVLSHIPMPRLGTLKCAVIILLWQSKGEGNAGGRRGGKRNERIRAAASGESEFFFFFLRKLSIRERVRDSYPSSVGGHHGEMTSMSDDWGR